MNVQYLAPTKRRSMSKARAALSLDRARSLLGYDHQTGILTWKLHRSGNAQAGSRAGSAAHWNGYRVIGLGGHQYQEHILAWLLFFGRWPDQQIDHVNGDRADNRIVNLRECSPSENAQNRPVHSDNKSGFIGVHLTANHRWRAQIKKDGVRHYLGDFDTPEQASAAYQKAKRQLHPFNPIPRQVRRG